MQCSTKWLAVAQASPHFCPDPDSASIVLSIGDSSPGQFPGEPTYGETPPSYQLRRQAIAGEAPAPPDSVRVWVHEDSLMRSAAYDSRLGFFIQRHSDSTDPSTLDPNEILDIMHQATRTNADALCMDVLHIQQWFIANAQSFRVYDLQLCFFSNHVKFHTKGWAYECGGPSDTHTPIIRGLDNVVMLFQLGV